MKSGWVDSEAQAAIDRYAAQGVGRDLAARVYTTRLLGGDPRLVLHGGGNTSVKTTMRDTLGDTVEVLVRKIDFEARKINLSARALTTSPWDTFSERVKAGARIRARSRGSWTSARSSNSNPASRG